MEIFEPSDLARCCFLEWLAQDLYCTDLGSPVDVLVHDSENPGLVFFYLAEELVFTLLVPVDDIFIESDEGYEFAVPRNNYLLFHIVNAIDYLFDFFRIDILS